MKNLESIVFLYLLAVLSYEDEEGTVTEGTVKRIFSKAQLSFCQEVRNNLIKDGHLESPKRSRLKMTESGYNLLIDLIKTTEYKFETVKGPKVLNALLKCSKSSQVSILSNASSEVEMSFEEFKEKLESLYYSTYEAQSLMGIIAIRRNEIQKDFLKKYPISEEKFNDFFEDMKKAGLFFVSIENNRELIDWAE